MICFAFVRMFCSFHYVWEKQLLHLTEQFILVFFFLHMEIEGLQWHLTRISNHLPHDNTTDGNISGEAVEVNS